MLRKCSKDVCRSRHALAGTQTQSSTPRHTSTIFNRSLQSLELTKSAKTGYTLRYLGIIFKHDLNSLMWTNAKVWTQSGGIHKHVVITRSNRTNSNYSIHEILHTETHELHCLLLSWKKDSLRIAKSWTIVVVGSYHHPRLPFRTAEQNTSMRSEILSPCHQWIIRKNKFYSGECNWFNYSYRRLKLRIYHLQTCL